MTSSPRMPKRPYRLMVTREFASIREGWVDLSEPRCSATFATREAAESKAKGWWGETSRAYVEGPEPV